MLNVFRDPPVSALIFDLDGTLLDTAEDLAASVNFARLHFELPALPVRTVTGYVGDGVNLLIERSFAGTGIQLETAKPVMSGHYKEHMLDLTRPYPGVAETLARLLQKKAVATNKPAEFVPGLLAHFGLDGFFELIVGGNSLPVRKPDAAIVDYVAQKLGIDKLEIVVVGDHRTDLALGQNAGIRTVFCEYGIGHDDGMVPTARIRTFSELQTIFC
ncbi:MAG: HAD-IA family hydrolase [Fibrobacterota bacterium]